MIVRTAKHRSQGRTPRTPSKAKNRRASMSTIQTDSLRMPRQARMAKVVRLPRPNIMSQKSRKRNPQKRTKARLNHQSRRQFLHHLFHHQPHHSPHHRIQSKCPRRLHRSPHQLDNESASGLTSDRNLDTLTVQVQRMQIQRMRKSVD